ncbi:hypothetical protein EK904_009343 [Melospiza melodia maxima]|nr:hypothetical protein EK904_009343 [Melospiza melodia maxima]
MLFSREVLFVPVTSSVMSKPGWLHLTGGCVMGEAHVGAIAKGKEQNASQSLHNVQWSQCMLMPAGFDPQGFVVSLKIEISFCGRRGMQLQVSHEKNSVYRCFQAAGRWESWTSAAILDLVLRIIWHACFLLPAHSKFQRSPLSRYFTLFHSEMYAQGNLFLDGCTWNSIAFLIPKGTADTVPANKDKALFKKLKSCLNKGRDL